MAKNQEAKETEFYKGIIRNLKKEIKHLKQRIRQLEKFEHNYNNPKEKDDEPLEQLKKCPDCGKGFIKEIEIVGRIFEVCSLCPHRKKLNISKKIQKKR